MIRRVLIVVMILLTTIGSAQTCFPIAAAAMTAQTEILDENDALSDQADLDLGHAHDGDPWMRRTASGAGPDAWDMSDVNFHPVALTRLKGRMFAPMHRPPIDERIAFPSDQPAESSSATT
jgi:hypothetical protein